MRERQTIKTVALPAAGASASTAPLDFGTALPGPQGKGFDLVVEVPALPSLANTKTATTILQDSANGTDYATIPGTGSLVQTGAGGVGAAAASLRLHLPPRTRRYVRATITVEADGGNNTARTLTMAVEI
jgi:uncharacterized SAM-dependent methyltransferase